MVRIYDFGKVTGKLNCVSMVCCIHLGTMLWYFIASDMCRPSVRDVRCAVSWCFKPIMGNYNRDFLLEVSNMGSLC
jgi:hypothetical protein